MNTTNFQSIQDIHDIQIEHLRAQHRHLKFMHEYHSRMMNEVAETRLGDLHGMIIEKVNEVLKDLDKLIETLQPTSLSEAHSIHGTSDYARQADSSNVLFPYIAGKRYRKEKINSAMFGVFLFSHS